MNDYECRLCLVIRPITDFEALPGGGRRRVCRLCLNAKAAKRTRERRQTDHAYRTMMNSGARRRRASTGFNSYQASYRKRKQEAAAGRPKAPHCEICGHKFIPGLPRHLACCFDHNHDTGLFRGWICGHCNAALGHAGENPRILLEMAKYLRERTHYTTRPLIR